MFCILNKENVLLIMQFLLTIYNLLIIHNIALFSVVFDAQMEVLWS